jgi:hypothetical protein
MSATRQCRLACLTIATIGLLALAGCSGRSSNRVVPSSPAACSASHDCVDFAVSGAVSGDLLTATPITSFISCRVLNGNPQVWLSQLYGDIAGHSWPMLAQVLNYTGPKTYDAAVSLTRTPQGSSQVYSGNGTLTLGIHALSGTLHAVLKDQETHLHSVRLSGRFRCLPVGG